MAIFFFVACLYLAYKLNQTRHERDQARRIASRRRTQRFVAETALGAHIGFERAKHELEEAHQAAFFAPYTNPDDEEIP